ncbi:MAG: UvrD-helicase domain-containing protein [Bacteroidales bacterium]|jgi:ATP-dependent helicase/nuclease subunit A
MRTGTLTIYSASAGSGKTFRLAGIYLSHLFRSKNNYRKILAVTFTNKATAEMKGRILDQLHALASGKRSEYLAELMKETGKNEDLIRKEAEQILFNILHDFSRFSVCTIDAFFQKILRSFAREVGLHSGFNIALDHTMILSTAVDNMIASSADDPELQSWLKDYVIENLDQERSWNLKNGIIRLSDELFREKFKILSEAEIDKLRNKQYLLGYIRNLSSLIENFEQNLIDFGKECDRIFTEHVLTDDMFFQKGKGIPVYIRNLKAGSAGPPGSAVLEILKDPPRWSTGSPAPQLLNAIKDGLEETLKAAIAFDNHNRAIYLTAKSIKSNIYTLGILSDVLNEVRLTANSENSFILSDAGEVLSHITKEDQAPFIYEKIGNRYENYMIDEFQDTSTLQWKNFAPLIENSMAEGNDNLVVGDIKQSIYRWRNSDWQILGRMKDESADQKRIISKPLTTNWRSRSEIIRFNNSLFSLIPAQMQKSFPADQLKFSFTDLYAEAVQDDPRKGSGGYVKLEFIDDEYYNDNNSEREENKKLKFKDIVLEKLPEVIEKFQQNGYSASDIGILVRERKEGEAVVRRMVEYAGNASPENKTRYNYNVVSNDSLTLSNSHVINFIVAVIKVLSEPDNMLAKAEMLRFFMLAKAEKNADSVPLYRENLTEEQSAAYPEGTAEFLDKTRYVTLFEVVENIIQHFDLGESTFNVAYLNTFQDQIINFPKSKTTDFDSFLEWWEVTGSSKSVTLPDNQNAASVFTIHKSKGLEFKIVILPFLSWELDHSGFKQPVLWIRPETQPFNDLGLVPVRYSRALADTYFAEDFYWEKSSSYLDNLNLLYVAMTRATDAIYGFLPGKQQRSQTTIADIVRNAVTSDENPAGEKGIILRDFYDKEKLVFELGNIPFRSGQTRVKNEIILKNYKVSRKPDSLKLKLHGENYFFFIREEIRQRINYGKLMHEVFEGIDNKVDIPLVIRNMVLEGKISASESAMLEEKILSLMSIPLVSEWFEPGNQVMREAEILLPSGRSRRPDRIILKNGRTILIDFKFGEENPYYLTQLREYRDLLMKMGYDNIDSYIWYPDQNKIITV